MNMKKAMAALLALCLLLGGALGALAELDVVNDMLDLFSGAADEAADPAPDAESSASADEAARQSEWENILLLGTDSRTSQQHARTDTMVILSINTVTHEIRLASLMRDIWVQVPGHGGAKLNAACVYGGPELTAQCVEESFGVDIHSYVLVNMQCLAAIVDALGGIRMDISASEAKAINRLFASDRNAHDENTRFAGDNVSAGSQVLLNGKQALAFARIRSLDDDYVRTERQREMLIVIAKQLQQQDLLSLAGIVTGLLQYVETDLAIDEIMAVAEACLGADLDGVTELRLPVEGTFQAGTFGGTWCIRPNFEENTRLLRAFIYGE